MTTYEKAVALWQGKHITNEAELTEALNGHSIAFAYHSGKIENEQITYNDTREVFEHDGVTSYTGDLRTLFEIRNAKDANELFLEAFEEKRPFTVELLKAFQKRLTQNTYDTRRWQLGERPGEFKHHDYVTGRNEIGAAPEDVEEEVSELFNELQEVREEILSSIPFLALALPPLSPTKWDVGILALKWVTTPIPIARFGLIK